VFRLSLHEIELLGGFAGYCFLAAFQIRISGAEAEDPTRWIDPRNFFSKSTPLSLSLSLRVSRLSVFTGIQSKAHRVPANWNVKRSLRGRKRIMTEGGGREILKKSRRHLPDLGLARFIRTVSRRRSGMRARRNERWLALARQKQFSVSAVTRLELKTFQCRHAAGRSISEEP